MPGCKQCKAYEEYLVTIGVMAGKSPPLMSALVRNGELESMLTDAEIRAQEDYATIKVLKTENKRLRDGIRDAVDCGEAWFNPDSETRTALRALLETK